jgi:formate/nitrite transporter
MADGAVGITALKIADAKCGLDFLPALTRGIYCNTLVCLAVWLTFSCRTTGDKILAIIFPITAFVACGFEHSVANMYFIPIGLFIKHSAPMGYWTMIGQNAGDYANLTWVNFFRNLLPVTIGNLIGGGAFVGAVYWIIYLRKKNWLESIRNVTVLCGAESPDDILDRDESMKWQTSDKLECTFLVLFYISSPEPQF